MKNNKKSKSNGVRKDWKGAPACEEEEKKKRKKQGGGRRGLYRRMATVVLRRSSTPSTDRGAGMIHYSQTPLRKLTLAGMFQSAAPSLLPGPLNGWGGDSGRRQLSH